MVTILSEILGMFRITNWMEGMAIIICLFLASSPGIAFTAIGLSAKLGLFQHLAKDGKEN
jgi:hypothetical protein